MLFRVKSLLLSWLASAALVGCGLFSTTSAPPAPAPQAAYDQVAAIRAAGERENSIIDVAALRDPGAAALQEAAKREEQSGHYDQAAATLDRALKISPQSPDLLQERAEVAIRLGDYPSAEKLAHESWSLGPKLGSLCARNWQTVVEVRRQVQDEVGVETAQKWVATCHKPGVPRY